MVTNGLEFLYENYKPNLVRRSRTLRSLHASTDIIITKTEILVTINLMI